MSAPCEVGSLVFVGRVLVAEANHPKFFRYEFYNLLVTLYDEAESRELAWTVAYNALFIDNFTKG